MEFFKEPWKHQLDALEMAIRLYEKQGNAELALFMEMGTGKTGTAINILRFLCGREKRLLKTLILGPVIVVRNWQDEFKMHSKINPNDVVALTGPGAKRVDTFTHFATDSKTHTLTRGKIFVTNYEAMEMDRLVGLIKEWKPEVLICDESQRLKNPSSIRAKQVVQLADLATHRLILTGTPILNSAMDIFNQYRILDRGQTFSFRSETGEKRPMNFYEFRAIYFEDLNKGMPSHLHFPKWCARQETYQELHQKIYRKAVRALRKDCLDLPPLVRETVHVTLGAEQARLYKEMKHEYIAWIKEHESTSEPRAVVAQMAVTKSLRLQQIASGFAKTEDGEEVRIKDNPRLTALGELLDELTPDNKVIVWATFHENYRQIAELCRIKKLKYIELHGGISQNDRNIGMDLFRKDPSIKVVIANQGAAGIGVNLVEASYSIFYSRNFSLEHDLQAEARNYRGGSEMHQKVTRIDLVAEDTIDELVLQALANKQNIAERVLDWTEKL